MMLQNIFSGIYFFPVRYLPWRSETVEITWKYWKLFVVRGFVFLVFSHKWGLTSACRDRFFTYLCEKTKNPTPRTTNSFQYFRVISTVFERHDRYLPGKKYIPEHIVCNIISFAMRKILCFYIHKRMFPCMFSYPCFALFRISKNRGVVQYFIGYKKFFLEDICHGVRKPFG